MPLAPPSIEVLHLSKSFRIVHHGGSLKRTMVEFLRHRPRIERQTALNDVSFSVQPGESIGIIGRNGSGKSTLLMLLAGIYRPSAGEVRVRGNVTTLLEISAGMHPDLTAEVNAVLLAMVYGLDRATARARLGDILEFAELSDRADQRIRHFSAGMAVRLGFSVAAHADPDVLLVDEILSVGDQEFQAKCRRRVAEFQAQGKTIVFVTHDLDAVRQTTTRVIWMDRSRLRMDGPTDEVLAAYQAATAGD